MWWPAQGESTRKQGARTAGGCHSLAAGPPCGRRAVGRSDAGAPAELSASGREPPPLLTLGVLAAVGAPGARAAAAASIGQGGGRGAVEALEHKGAGQRHAHPDQQRAQAQHPEAQEDGWRWGGGRGVVGTRASEQQAQAGRPAPSRAGTRLMGWGERGRRGGEVGAGQGRAGQWSQGRLRRAAGEARAQRGSQRTAARPLACTVHSFIQKTPCAGAPGSVPQPKGRSARSVRERKSTMDTALRGTGLGGGSRGGLSALAGRLASGAAGPRRAGQGRAGQGRAGQGGAGPGLPHSFSTDSPNTRLYSSGGTGTSASTWRGGGGRQARAAGGGWVGEHAG